MFPTKSQAILFALAWAENHQPNEIHVYGTLGELERSIVCPNGNQLRAADSDRRQVNVNIQFPERRRAERREKA